MKINWGAVGAIATIIGVFIAIRQCQIAQDTTISLTNPIENSPNTPDERPKDLMDAPENQPRIDNTTSEPQRKLLEEIPAQKSKPVVEANPPTSTPAKPVITADNETDKDDFSTQQCFTVQGNSDGGGAIQLYRHPTKGMQPLKDRLEPGTRVIILAKSDNKEMVKIKAENSISGWVAIERVLPCQ
ncbi:MAG: hypothetical protein KIS77_13295 [Saprospiraceae bacterium]|nr:hypothetical protein [Saprospiraceae bacterium]